MKNFLGIIGGIGPEASAYLYSKIINKTKARKDQDHIDMIILNHASIPDRTKYLLGESNDSPLPYLLDDISKLNDMGASLIIVPCNTSLYFYEELQKNSTSPILNMIEDTILYLKNKNIKKVGILATNGTIKMGLYQHACKRYNIEPYVLSETNQNVIMDIIYNNIKAGTKINIDNFNIAINEMKDNQVDVVIMGCTELSVLKDKLNLNDFFIDPLEIETSKILTFYNKEERKD